MASAKHIIALWLALFTFTVARSQITDRNILQFVTGPEFNSLNLQYPEQVRQFYQQNSFKPVWIFPDEVERRNSMFDLLRSASNLGLNASDYLPKQFSMLGSYFSFLNTQYDSLRIELILTDAIIHFLHDVKNGNSKPSFSFEGLQYTPSSEHIISSLEEAVSLNDFATVIAKLEPDFVSYQYMKAKLVEWNKVINDPDFEEVVITSNKINRSNSNLQVKLQQFGFLHPGDLIDESVLKVKIKEAQRFFDLTSDGVLGTNTITAFNVPLKARRSELISGINYLRWLNEIRKTGYVALLNIPSAQLLIYKEGQRIFDSRIIVGKPSTPTATLTSSIKEVIVYPYWNVPHSIATKELLPLIKKNISYLGKNNFQVLDQHGKEINPYTISWHSLSATYFPYQIRQSTGCDNSLGILKFNFYNPFSMYLHDTPAKSLFLLSRRFFSHGCMRVEKPVELARLLIAEKISSVENLINECIEDQSPVIIQMEHPLPLMVLYSTVWFDEKGAVKFYKDIYKKLPSRQEITANSSPSLND
jgi:murein L,D-transpeptidase YcbB/YkuD